MKVPKSIPRSDSKQTLQSQWMQNEQLNDSVDLESEVDPTEKTTKVHLMPSRFVHRPPTIFFFYPKCCKLEQNTEKLISLEKASLSYKIVGSEYRCIINSL